MKIEGKYINKIPENQRLSGMLQFVIYRYRIATSAEPARRPSI